VKKYIVMRNSVTGDVKGTTGRENANGVDLNRNFPGRFDDFFYSLPDSDVRKSDLENKVQEKETQAVMKWLLLHNFVLSGNLHGGSLVANFPMDDNRDGKKAYTAAPDNTVFRELALSYSMVSNNKFKV